MRLKAARAAPRNLDFPHTDCNTPIPDATESGQVRQNVNDRISPDCGYLNFEISGSVPASVRRALTVRFDRGPIATVDELVDFVQTRAAYVAQTSLYGYLKTRMGTRYRYMFDDEVYSKSIDFAKWRIYASCLSDLAVFAQLQRFVRAELNKDESIELARSCFDTAVRQTFVDVDDDALAQQVIEPFRRTRGTYRLAGRGIR